MVNTSVASQQTDREFLVVYAALSFSICWAAVDIPMIVGGN